MNAVRCPPHTVTIVSTSADDRAIPRGLAIGVFAAVVLLIVIVLGVQLIPEAKRPTIRQVPTTITTTIVISSPVAKSS